MSKEYDLLLGNNLELLGQLEPKSVHTAITSPPYFPSIRDYGAKPTLWFDGWIGCLGNETDPQKYCEHLVDIFRSLKRALRDDGTLWVNIGDSFAKNNKFREFGIKQKDIFGIPWMFAFAMRTDGWYLRNDHIWNKPDCMPDSAQDRFVRSHEYLFQFAKTDKYYFDHQAVREPASDVSLKRIAQKNFANQKGGEKDYGKTGVNKSRSARKAIENFARNPGRNKRTVWNIPTARLKENHFAAFPTKLPEICLLASTSAKGCCTSCGSPWIRVVDKERIATRPALENKNDDSAKANRDPQRHITIMNTAGWKPSCDCNIEDVQPCTVLDPFNGAGSTGVAAVAAGRRYIGIELVPEYVDISKRRIDKALKLKSMELFDMAL